MTKVITFANFKGGTGKTTTTVMVAYELAKKGYKVLLADQDPQADSTKLLLKTYANIHDHAAQFNKTLMAAMHEGDLRQIVTPIMSNLDLLPSFRDFKNYPDFLEDMYPGATNRPKRAHYFKQLLAPIVDDYDFVLIDVPPTISIYTSGALYTSDAVVITLQTQEASLEGAEEFIKELQEFVDEQQVFVDVVGVLPVIMKKKGAVDLATLANATQLFGEENIFEHKVEILERIKRWAMIGITDNPKDMHDNYAHKIYSDIASEFLERMEKI